MYVALGDSMSIDRYAGGEGRGAASLFYRNHPDWPEFAGRDLLSIFPDLAFRLLAFDGATSEGVLSLQVPTLRELPVRPRVITLTVGGNDVLTYFGIGERDGDQAARHLRVRLERILEACCSVVGDLGCVLAGTIYDPTDGTGQIEGSGFPLWGDAMAVLERFNRTIAEVVAEFPARLVDIHRHFCGHGAWVQGPAARPDRGNDPATWYTQLIEPNARGAHEIRKLFWDAFLESPLGRSLEEAPGRTGGPAR